MRIKKSPLFSDGTSTLHYQIWSYVLHQYFITPQTNKQTIIKIKRKIIIILKKCLVFHMFSFRAIFLYNGYNIISIMIITSKIVITIYQKRFLSNGSKYICIVIEITGSVYSGIERINHAFFYSLYLLLLMENYFKNARSSE